MGKRINLAGFIAATLAVASIQAKAVELDLRTAGASGTINGAFFDQINPQSTGTGVLDPFLRIQANDQEQGYNSNAAPLDDKSGTWTHDLLLSSLGAVDYKDVDCYQFVLDINENTGSNNELLSLDSVKIYTSTTPNQSVALGSLIGTLRYDLDTGGDNAILLDYSLNSGSGSGDMNMFVPISLFAGVPSNEQYLILYSHFGAKGFDSEGKSLRNGYDSSDGFEEWAGVIGVIPEPNTVVLVGISCLSLAGLVRRRR